MRSRTRFPPGTTLELRIVRRIEPAIKNVRRARAASLKEQSSFARGKLRFRMPKQTFIWEEAKGSHLELSWEWQWKNFTLNLAGQSIGTIADENALRKGQTFSLAEGSSLKVQLINRFLFPILVVLKDGYPLQEVPSERNL